MLRRTLFLSTLTLAALPAAAAQAAAPAAPVGLSVRPAGKAAATLSWDAVKGAPRYRLLRSGRKVAETRRPTIKVRLTRTRARYQVVALNAHRRAGERSRTVTVVRGHKSPRTPIAPAASKVTDSSALLSWGRPKARRRSRIAGYRLIAGTGVQHRTVRSVKRTRVRLKGLPSLRSLTYRVIAYDRAGWASRPSRKIHFVTGHTAPSAPGAPRATSVSDTALSLQWAAAGLPRGSRLRGYRLLRDGVVTKQVPATQADLTNLAPKSSHDWSVAAIDTRGYASAPSPVTRVVQGDPPPTTGTSHAFLLASTDASFEAFQRHYRKIGYVYPTFFDCNRSTGAVEGKDDQLIVRYAQDRKVKVLPRFNCQTGSVLHKILTDPATRTKWLDTMTSLAEQHGYDGVNVDFEQVPADDRAALTSFIHALSDRLHAKGKLLSQAVSAKTKDSLTHPRSGAFDYPELSKYDDFVFVMAWGIHWSTSAPGAQDDLSWVKQVVDYVTTMPNQHKFVIGTMLYGFDWPSGGGPDHPATALPYADVQALIGRYGITPAYDSEKDAWHFSYTDPSGVPHEVWYSDAPVVNRRVDLAHQHGFKNGFWRIGQEDERIWDNPELPGASG